MQVIYGDDGIAEKLKQETMTHRPFVSKNQDYYQPQKASAYESPVEHQPERLKHRRKADKQGHEDERSKHAMGDGVGGMAMPAMPQGWKPTPPRLPAGMKMNVSAPHLTGQQKNQMIQKQQADDAPRQQKEYEDMLAAHPERKTCPGCAPSDATRAWFDEQSQKQQPKLVPWAHARGDQPGFSKGARNPTNDPYYKQNRDLYNSMKQKAGIQEWWPGGPKPQGWGTPEHAQKLQQVSDDFNKVKLQ